MDERVDESLTGSDGLTTDEQLENKRYCLNCETELTDSYCPHCGQKDIPKRQTLGELLTNFISSFWSYESKFFKTGQYLLLKPGFLPIEYNEGRRERYFHPARMYVFISFIYFLLLYSVPDADEHDTVIGSPDNSAYKGYGTSVLIDTLGFARLSQYDSIQKTLPIAERDGWLAGFFVKRKIEVIQKYTENPTRFAADVSSSFTANFPKIFFMLLPVFALLLKLLYFRKDFFYSEHLVFSICFYNFFFLAGSLYMLFNLSDWLQWLAIGNGMWIALYLLLGMKNMYKQKWSTTVMKYVAFSLIFSVCVIIGLLLNLTITLMYI